MGAITATGSGAQRVARLACSFSIAAFVVGTCLALTLTSRDPATAVLSAAYLGAAVACLAKSRAAVHTRVAWVILAVGLLGQGYSTMTYFARAEAAYEFPSSADLALLFYPATLAATVLIVQRTLPRLPRALWLDAAIGGGALAALGAAVIAGPLIDLPGTKWVGPLIYALADLAVVGLLVVACAFAGFSRAQALFFLVASWVCTAIADVSMALGFDVQTMPVPLIAGIGWAAGGVLMGAAAASEEPQPRAERDPRWALVTVPVTAAVIAVALPVLEADDPVVVAISVVLLALVVARLAISLVDNQRAAERARQEHEARRAAEAAERANQAKTEFLSRMSHEMRTPLNSILGFAQLLVDDVDGSGRESVERILRAGNHLRRLIDDVLDLSAIEAGDPGTTLEPVDLGWAIEESVTLLEPLAGDRLAAVGWENEAPETSVVIADPQRLKQVLINLISNAIKYGGERPVVTVRTEERGDRAVVSVEDTGPGISADALDSLWMPFERGSARGTDIEGSGLGLALTRNLVTAMDGAIDVDTGPDGTTFSFTLPLTTESPLRLSTGDGRPGIASGQHDERRCVLYIEDQETNLELVASLLARRGDVELVSAATGAEGIERAFALCPDAILLDLDLPDMRGEEVLAELQADPVLTEVPVIVVSADATSHRQETLRAAGATAYVVKPLQLAAFLATLDRVLSAEREWR